MQFGFDLFSNILLNRYGSVLAVLVAVGVLIPSNHVLNLAKEILNSEKSEANRSSSSVGDGGNVSAGSSSEGAGAHRGDRGHRGEGGDGVHRGDGGDACDFVIDVDTPIDEALLCLFARAASSGLSRYKKRSQHNNSNIDNNYGINDGNNDDNDNDCDINNSNTSSNSSSSSSSSRDGRGPRESKKMKDRDMRDQYAALLQALPTSEYQLCLTPMGSQGFLWSDGDVLHYWKYTVYPSLKNVHRASGVNDIYGSHVSNDSYYSNSNNSNGNLDNNNSSSSSSSSSNSSSNSNNNNNSSKNKSNKSSNDDDADNDDYLNKFYTPIESSTISARFLRLECDIGEEDFDDLKIVRQKRIADRGIGRQRMTAGKGDMSRGGDGSEEEGDDDQYDENDREYYDGVDNDSEKLHDFSTSHDRESTSLPASSSEDNRKNTENTDNTENKENKENTENTENRGKKLPDRRVFTGIGFTPLGIAGCVSAPEIDPSVRPRARTRKRDRGEGGGGDRGGGGGNEEESLFGDEDETPDSCGYGTRGDMVELKDDWLTVPSTSHHTYRGEAFESLQQEDWTSHQVSTYMVLTRYH